MDEVKNVGQEIEETVEEVENFIVINDGRIDIPIRNQFGEQTGVFRFNPTDLNIVNRYNSAADKFSAIAKPLEDVDISPDGTSESSEGMKALNDAEDKMIELFDYVLNGDSRTAFFSTVHCFTPTDGTFYCGVVFDALGAFVEKKFEVETKKIDLRMKKYTHGYRTGQHRKGRK